MAHTHLPVGPSYLKSGNYKNQMGFAKLPCIIFPKPNFINIDCYFAGSRFLLHGQYAFFTKFRDEGRLCLAVSISVLTIMPSVLCLTKIAQIINFAFKTNILQMSSITYLTTGHLATAFHDILANQSYFQFFWGNLSINKAGDKLSSFLIFSKKAAWPSLNT